MPHIAFGVADWRKEFEPRIGAARIDVAKFAVGMPDLRLLLGRKERKRLDASVDRSHEKIDVRE